MILTAEHAPIWLKAYCHAYAEQDFIKKEVAKLQKLGLIRKAKST